jgi:hypothetical protein
MPHLEPIGPSAAAGPVPPPERDARGSAPRFNGARAKMIAQTVLFVAGGALAGYLYHRFVGCRSGACPITANPYISTLYGAVIGFLLAR